MELIFAVLGGIICGGIAHVIVPRRQLRGLTVAPAVGGIVAAIVWEALSWAGWKYDGTWIWVAALVAAGGIAIIAALVISPRRERSDAEYFEQVRAQAV